MEFKDYLKHWDYKGILIDTAKEVKKGNVRVSDDLGTVCMSVDHPKALKRLLQKFYQAGYSHAIDQSVAIPLIGKEAKDNE
jgi:hypothetical protein